MVIVCFVRRDRGDCQERQAKIADLDQHPVQRGLVGERPTQNRFAVGFVADGQVSNQADQWLSRCPLTRM